MLLFNPAHCILAASVKREVVRLFFYLEASWFNFRDYARWNGSRAWLESGQYCWTTLAVLHWSSLSVVPVFFSLSWFCATLYTHTGVMRDWNPSCYRTTYAFLCRGSLSVILIFCAFTLFAPQFAQESCAVGIRSVLTDNDSVMTAYRCHGWAYLMGVSQTGVLAELFGMFLKNSLPFCMITSHLLAI